MACSDTASPGAGWSVDTVSSIALAASAVSQRSGLPPERLVRLVLDRNAGIHLPEPRVLHAQRGHAPASVALRGEHHARRAVGRVAGQQHRRARTRATEHVHRRERRQRAPPLGRRANVWREREWRVHLAGRCAAHAHRDRRDDAARVRARGAVEDHRHDLLQRRARVATLRERAPAAEEEQPTAAHAHEVGEHAQLLGGERARLDAAEDDRAVGEELLARRREAADEIEAVAARRAAGTCAPRCAAGRRAAAVLSSTTARRRNFDLEARLALEVEDALGRRSRTSHQRRRSLFSVERLARQRAARGTAADARRASSAGTVQAAPASRRRSRAARPPAARPCVPGPRPSRRPSRRPRPRCATTTSTGSAEPRSTVRDASTRATSRSRTAAGAPTPTVNTGVAARGSASVASRSAAAPPSAPSDTTTTPASGTPSSSSRTRSSARAETRPVAVEASARRCRPRARDVGETVETHRELGVRARGAAARLGDRDALRARRRRAAAVPSRARACCASRPRSTATVLRCGTAAASTSTGRSRHDDQQGERGDAKASPSSARSRRVAAPCARAVGPRRRGRRPARPRRPATPRADWRARRTTSRPCAKSAGRYLSRSSSTESRAASMTGHAVGSATCRYRCNARRRGDVAHAAAGRDRLSGRWAPYPRWGGRFVDARRRSVRVPCWTCSRSVHARRLLIHLSGRVTLHRSASREGLGGRVATAAVHDATAGAPAPVRVCACSSVG